ncbi:MAG TPA: SEC-C metal-binding domain-containing protein [Candidatus Tumulicola sp.]|nr:SEC-C metal-binding domain-containing protein [Candidatus Tumulicola sp.]
MEPGLRLVEQAGATLMTGSIRIVQEGSGHVDTVDVEIAFPRDYPSIEPKIRETGGRFEADSDRHIGPKERYFCLWIPEESKWNPGDPDSILTWFYEVVVFIQRQLAYEVLGEWTGPERRHGDDGRIDYLMEKTGCDITTAQQAMTIYNGGQGAIGRKSLCPCGSGKSWEKCHRATVTATVSLLSRRSQ